MVQSNAMRKIKLKKNPHSRRIGKRFEKLVDLMFTLRSEEGCPWDRAQSLSDLKQYLLEETYELLEVLDLEEAEGMREELGDLMFQVVFLSQIMQERGMFTLADVLDDFLEKMIGRHPHVFGEVKAKNPEQALASWEGMKQKQFAEAKGRKRGLLHGVPRNLPALLQANLISCKVARVGFDWKTEGAVWTKFREEVKEFQEASSGARKFEELGDMLFTLVNVARKHRINPEDALRAANAKFRKRFSRLEEIVHESKREVIDVPMKELDETWNKVKREKRKGKQGRRGPASSREFHERAGRASNNGKKGKVK